MQNLKLSKTERLLLASISVLILAVMVNVSLNNSNSPLTTFADEHSGESQASVSDSEESDSNDAESVDEVSTPSVDEVSTPSIPSVDEMSVPSVDEVSVSGTGEMSTPSTPSTPSVDEVSTPSEPSVDEASVRSGGNIDDLDGVGELISVGDDVAVVFEDERLFFLIPVKIQKTLLLGEDGVILDVQQNLLNRLLSIFSF